MKSLRSSLNQYSCFYTLLYIHQSRTLKASRKFGINIFIFKLNTFTQSVFRSFINQLMNHNFLSRSMWRQNTVFSVTGNLFDHNGVRIRFTQERSYHNTVWSRKRSKVWRKKDAFGDIIWAGWYKTSRIRSPILAVLAWIPDVHHWFYIYINIFVCKIKKNWREDHLQFQKYS